MFYLQVVECVNSDALVVKTADGVQKKIHFSSLRPPRYCSCNQLNSSLAGLFFGACIFSAEILHDLSLISHAKINVTDILVALRSKLFVTAVNVRTLMSSVFLPIKEA